MKKRIVILILGALLMVNLNVITFAAGNNEQIFSPRWENINNVDGALSVSGNTGRFSAIIYCNSNVTQITAIATLYYKDSSNRWIVIPTNWEYSKDLNYLAINETFNAIPGVTYKVVFEADVYANGYTESITKEFT